MTTPTAPASPPGLKQTTLGAQGKNLPVGVLAGGALNKSFALRPFRLKEEKALQKLKDDHPQMAMPRYATLILASMVQSAGGHDFDKLDDAQRQLVLKQMYMADVLYMYVYLRRESMGKDMTLRLICPKCKASYEWVSDLDTLDISAVDDPATLRRDMALEAGFALRGKTVRRVTTEPVRWMALDGRTTADQGDVKASILRDSIVGAEGIPEAEMGPIPDGVLDEMTKRDAELLSRHIEKVAPGVKMLIEASHDMNPDGSKGCGAKMIQMLDWSFDSFFGFSSL